MKRKFDLMGVALLTSVAMFIACGDDSGSNPKTDDPIFSYDSSSSADVIIPGSSAIDPASSGSEPTVANSSSDAVTPVPGSSSDAIVPLPASSSGAVVESSSSVPAAISSSSVAVASSSSSIAPVSSSSEIALGPTEKTYAFGYALKNAPRPSKGCGKDATLKGTVNWSCEQGKNCDMSAQQFSIKVNASGEDRTYYMTFPSNYDKTKPYKLLFANHCMGSSSNHMATWINADQDHPSPYYAQKAQDTEGNYIFVAPQGDGSGMWTKGEKDHQFISELLTQIEDNYCIDESRVFMTGFSFGAMFSNSLAQTFQSRVRAVAVYAVADYNIYLPDNAGKPIAWMAVHGTNDGMCDYNRAKNSAVKRILKNNGKASDGDSQFTDASSEDVPAFNGGNHQCYDFTKVDERFPVKFCSWSGQHQWTANDSWNNDWGNSWVPGEVHKFFEQF